ncbi:MAG: hypothetical protein KAG28_05815 [Cocleimonas sp.]|nr:hypothetical protein [Cocleimonas sp.]
MTSLPSDLTYNPPSHSDDPLSHWRQLTLRVKAKPHDFNLHTQRIMLARDLQIQPYLAGALQDFFISVKTKGRPLREKMFHLVTPLLERESRTYFMTWLANDSDQGLVCKRFPGAIFLSNTCQPSEEEEDKDHDDESTVLNAFLDEQYDNPIDKALYCVAYGCIEHAQTLLEESLDTQRGINIKTEETLLEIYYYSKNKQSFDKLSKKRLETGLELSEDWKKIQNIAKEW